MKAKKQLSEIAIRERLRATTPNVLERLAKLVESKNDSVALGACRLILDKVMPDIKAVHEEQTLQEKSITFVVTRGETAQELKKLYGDRAIYKGGV